MIKRNEYAGDLAIGARLKATTASSLDAVTETSQLLADTITTARSAVELMHGALQPAIAEQKLEYAKIIQNGVKDLVSGGMDEKTAQAYLTT